MVNLLLLSWTFFFPTLNSPCWWCNWIIVRFVNSANEIENNRKPEIGPVHIRPKNLKTFSEKDGHFYSEKVSSRVFLPRLWEIITVYLYSFRWSERELTWWLRIHCFRIAPWSKYFPSVHENEKTSRTFSNSPSLKSVFEKLLFHYGLVWTEGNNDINDRLPVYCTAKSEEREGARCGRGGGRGE